MRRRRLALIIIAHRVQAVRYALRVAYDGTHFRGWQVQPQTCSQTGRRVRTVEGCLREAFGKRFDGLELTGTTLLGASRTDAGVHAKGQAAHVDLPAEVGDLGLLTHQLNRILPDDVRINQIQEAPTSANYPDWWEASKPWHAIASSTGKRYVYKMRCRRGAMDPLDRLYRGHVAYEELDFEILTAALEKCRGTKDFKAFANNAPTQNPLEIDTVRTIHRIDVVAEGGGDYAIAMDLDGALYRMVRNIVGACVACGTGKLELDVLDELLSGRCSRRDNPTKSAPARGLCLEEVFYDDFGA